MTISKIYAPQTYECDGIETNFPITFDYLSTDTLIDVTVISSAGVESLKVLNTDYTVQDDTVIFVSGSIPSSTSTVRISLDPRYTQPTNYKSNTVFPKSSYETGVDSLTLTVQSIKDILDNSIVFPVIGEDPDITVGTMAAQNADLVNITGGSISLTTPLPIASGGTGASTVSSARTNLGLGTISTQNADNVSITGGNVEGVAININGTTRDLSPDTATDYIMTYDASATTNKKVLLSTLASGTYELSDDNDPELGANLDLNTRSIVFPGSTISDVKDQDNMSSDSATSSVTQQSYKAYVDAQPLTTHKMVIYGGINSATYHTSGGGDYFFFPGNASGPSYWVAPCDGTISNFYFGLYAASNTSTQNLEIELGGGISGTPLTITIPITNGTDNYNVSNLVYTDTVTSGTKLYCYTRALTGSNKGITSTSFSFIFTPS